MPTGGKLIAAICFGALAYFITDLVKPLLPEGTQVGWFSPINALIGMAMGWTIMGKGAGVSLRQSLGYGLTTLAATAFWCLVFWSGYEMLQTSMRKGQGYNGPVEALQDMAQMAIDNAVMAGAQEVIWPAIIGAIFMSWLTDFFARRWT